jgi:hypothetical protein
MKNDQEEAEKLENILKQIEKEAINDVNKSGDFTHMVC